jgi:flagellar L-ring protein precursor FlgH
VSRVAPALAALILAGCNTTPLVRPELSPVGSGLAVTRTALPATVPVHPQSMTPGSLYGRRARDLLTDVRAGDVGDTLTVVIMIDDKAEFDNESERSRASSADANLNIFGSGQGFDGPGGEAELEGGGKLGSSSKYKGAGAIDRSEKLSLLVAAVVTEVLENGNLVISGSQEVRVNDEIRVLEVRGFVNPLDVTRENTVDYQKIAEARISYGGRGRQSEIQSPNWGQQIYDRVVPF